MPGTPRPSGFAILALAALAILVCVVFRPILDCQFVDYDVRQQLLQNPHVHGLSAENLKYIFTSRCVTSYYPLRSLTYAADYEFDGLNAQVFKLTNAAFHLANVFLVFWLVLRLFRHPSSGHESAGNLLEASLAAFSAAVFAVHPVVVESVVWVPGREELLMTLGALACLHFHISARLISQNGDKTRRAVLYHLAAVAACAAACLSNAAGAVIPSLIVAWDLLTLEGPKFAKVVRGTAALWFVAAMTIVIKQAGGGEDAKALPCPFSLGPLMVMGQVYWLNLTTLVRPTGLTIHYDWPLSKEAMLPGVVAGWTAICLSVLLIRTLWRKGLVVYGLAWFFLGLVPALHVIPHTVFRADRHLYLPLVGIVLAIALGLRALKYRLPKRLTKVSAIAAVVAGVEILVILGGLSSTQVRTWRTRLSLWEHCLELQPNSSKGHDAYADALLNAGRVGPALDHYGKSLSLDPRNTDAVTNISLQLATGDPQIRDCRTAVLLVEEHCERIGRQDPGLLRTLAVCYASLASELETGGDLRGASQVHERALQVARESGDAELVRRLSEAVDCRR